MKGGSDKSFQFSFSSLYSSKGVSVCVEGMEEREGEEVAPSCHNCSPESYHPVLRPMVLKWHICSKETFVTKEINAYCFYVSL